MNCIIPRNMIYAILLLAAIVAPARLNAQSVQVTGKMEQLQLSPRSYAIVPVRWTLENHTMSLVEGRIALTIRINDQVYLQQQSQELVLSNGEQIVDMTIPAPRNNDTRGYAEVSAAFIKTKGGAIEFEPQQIRFPENRRRVFILGQFSSELETSEKQSEASAFITSLQIESYSPNEKEQNLSTIWSREKTEDLPSVPLELCQYDIVLLSEKCFDEMAEKQSKALITWVKAGGALCISTATEVEAKTADNVAAFLNDNSKSPLFVPGENGKLTASDEVLAKKFLSAHVGWGRVVVVVGEQTNDVFKSPEWKAMVRFLWRIRNDQAQSLMKEGKWTVPKPDDNYTNYYQYGYGYYGRGTAYRPTATVYNEETKNPDLSFFNWPLTSSASIFQHLLPDGIRLIPISQIAMLLFVYVMLVGPGEYFLLGKLKMRKWTWVTFPIITIIFTFGMITYTNNYMSSNVQSRAFDIVDIDSEGNVVRRNRYELLFPNRSSQVNFPLQGALFSSLDAKSMTDVYGYQNTQERPKPTLITGYYPARADATQVVPKWTPQFNRTLTFSPKFDDDFPGKSFDWSKKRTIENKAVGVRLSDRLTKKTTQTPVKADQVLIDEVKQAFGDTFMVYAIRGTKGLVNEQIEQRKPTTRLVATSGEIFHSPPDEFENEYYRQRYATEAHLSLTPFWSDITGRSQFGLYSLINQISPSGGPYFEDLTVIDPSDPEQHCLMIIVPHKDDFVIFRQFYPQKLTDSAPSTD